MIYVPQCHSTNTLAADLSQKEEVREGTVVITSDQTAGRGQRGNSWESEPGKNLTFSLILKPPFLTITDQFQMNRAISLGLADYIETKVAGAVKIKWPNDILVAGKKVSGILIENHLSGNKIQLVIAGIGVNVNQKLFGYPKAGSLGAMTGKDFFLPKELDELLECLEGRYLDLRKGNFQSLEKDYLAFLYGKGLMLRFKSAGIEFDGTIAGVDEVGRLRVETANGERSFGVKEVEFLE
jgi:BirA family transcriptional regulator, biotin operon repressor / biotin---[acetyl-CoA-carboxylase] ligase